MTDIKSPRPYATAPAYQPAQPVSARGLHSLNYGEMYHLLGQAEGEIKKIRGWHGSRLAVAGGVVGGVAAVGGIGAATVMTGGGALVAAAALAGGGAAVGGGALAGWFKTRHGKHACKQNALLMDKIGLLAHLRAELKNVKKQQGLAPAQRRLYRDLKAVTNKVDRSSLKEARNAFGKASLGVVGGVAGTAAAAAAVLVLVAAGAGDGGGDIFFCGGGNGGSCGCMGGARVRMPKGEPTEATGVSVNDQQLHVLRTVAVA